MLDNVVEALSLLFTVKSLFFMITGLVLGIVVGAIPGLGGSMAVGVLLPMTYTMSMLHALLLLTGIYKGCMVGGSFSAILINTPGDAPAAATLLDGFPMNQNGESRKALQAAIFGSSFGDFVSDILLVVGAVTLAPLVLKFGPSQIFWVGIFSLVVTGCLAGKSIWFGLVSIIIGLLLGCVGLDVLSATPRFGVIPKLGLLEGIDLIAFLIGAFAVSEVLFNILPSQRRENAKNLENVAGFYGPSLTRKEFFSSFKAMFTGSGIGCFIGAVPGLGATAAAFLSYGISKQLYGNKGISGKKFGEGAVEGVFACESANSAVSGCSFIPMLCLGIPGSATGALILAAFVLHGISPGPGIFNHHAPLIFAFFFALMLGAVLNIPLSFILAKPLTWLLKKNPSIVYPIVLLLCFAGTYSINQRVFDLGILCAVSLLAFGMKRVSIPLAPMVIAFILSNIIEQNFRMSMAITRGQFYIFWDSTINKVLIAMTVIAFITFVVQRLRGKEVIDDE